MNRMLIIIAILALAIPAWAVGPTVSNVQAHQRADGSHIVDISYNLSDPDSETVYVSVQISTDGGSTWTITPTSFEGTPDVGWVRRGTQRRIAWKAGTDYPTAVWSSCKAKIIADDASGGVYPGQMVYIPAGSFLMGNNGHEAHSYPSELPQHSVYLSGYWIGRYEVTRGEYQRFMQAGGYSNPAWWSSAGWSWRVSYGRTEPSYWAAQQNWGSPPGTFTQTDNHPVVGISYYEAEAFCNWAGGHLPTDAQWEKAARWTHTASTPYQPRAYPWGDIWDQQRCNSWSDSLYPGYQTAPVGSYPMGASPYGLHDMAGNVFEWTNDWYQVDYYSQTPPGGWVNPQGPTTGSYRSLRGGCWGLVDGGGSDYCRCAYRHGGGLASLNWYGSGFRIAR